MLSLQKLVLKAAIAALVLSPARAAAQVSERQQVAGGEAAPSGAEDTRGAEGEGFWQALDDSTLGRLMEETLRVSPRLRAATARVDEARASRLDAVLGLAPVVTASAGYSRRRFSSYAFPGGGASALPDEDVWESGLDASWELDVFGRLRGEVRARGRLREAARADLSYDRISVTADLARSYFDLRGAQARLDVARENAENQRRTLELTERRVAAGRTADFDAERARAQLDLTLAAIPPLEADIAAAAARIASRTDLTRDSLDEMLGTAAGLPELPDSVPALGAGQVVERRPDILSAERRVAASAAEVESARADYLPRLRVVAHAGYAAQALGAFGDRGTFNYTVGPVLSWSAFDMGRVKARVDEAQAREIEARAAYDQVQRDAREEIDAATARYGSARERLRRLDEAAAASERAAALARRRYEGGIADLLDVLDSERTLLLAQDQRTQAEAQAAEAYVRLYEARGGIWR